MWVIKTHGETFYVNHVTCELPWSTKETPDNTRTRGSIRIRDCLLTINDDNEATLVKLTTWDRIRLRNQKLGITRIIMARGGPMHRALASNEFQHSPFKNVLGDCGSNFVICDLLDKQEATLAGLRYSGWFRILQPNEAYYRAYDQPGDTIEESGYDAD